MVIAAIGFRLRSGVSASMVSRYWRLTLEAGYIKNYEYINAFLAIL